MPVSFLNEGEKSAQNGSLKYPREGLESLAAKGVGRCGSHQRKEDRIFVIFLNKDILTMRAKHVRFSPLSFVEYCIKSTGFVQ